ncbi:MAG TPA: low temperature requirement protein A [Candidatus Dormibacteraeota bacterium]|nr:low temperature requirement protein A [Candidatus Dormibacteraeota bacterium]
MTGPAKSEFKRWLTAPPRPHGAIIKDRTVSNLELFYDLVYVAVITGASNRLTADTSIRGFAEFAVVFAMIWIAWINGSLYVELHGREDGRTRLLVFVQMGILALLAVFTQDAAGTEGPAFAFVYAAFLALMTWQWNIVRNQDRVDNPEFLPVTKVYVGGLVLSTAAIAASALLPLEPRLALWASFAGSWIVGIRFAARRPRVGLSEGVVATQSLVERFGAFTIIVLGEVILGVVEGLSAAQRDLITIVTGSFALIVGFGYWWIYFDLIGRRMPRDDRGVLSIWMLSHIPITLSITASGAAIVSLVEHAHDAATPASTAWLLAGAVAIGLLAMILTARALMDAVRLESVYRPLTWLLALGASAAIVIAWLDPAPWLLALGLVAILSAVWFFAVAWLIRAGEWGRAVS